MMTSKDDPIDSGISSLNTSPGVTRGDEEVGAVDINCDGHEE